MQVTTVKKVRATSFRLATVSRRAVLAALVLVVLASVVPAQLMAQDAIAVLNQPLVPNAVAPGGPGFNLTVYGTGFASGAVLNWNGSPRVTTVTNATKLSAAILATDIATAKTASITVTNVGGIPSNPVLFEVAKSGTAVFMSRNDLNVNTSATAVASGDFRGIGKTDLAVANSANSIDILLGNGDGTFQTAVNYPLASGFPTAIVAADVNGDGKLDLVVLLAHIKMVGVLLGNGDGTFTVGKNFGTGNNPVSLTVADVNGDGKLDALVANKNDNTVSVLLGNGNGTFQTKQDYGTGVKPDSVTVGDFNADGLLDLAVANNTDNTVSVLLGAGSGTFPTHVDYATGVLPVWVVTADFNGDGKLDLAVSTTAGTISILLGVGDGTFGAHTDYKVNTNPQMMVAADFNGDGKTDLANVNFTNSSVSLLLGVGDGTFKSEAVYPTNTNPGFLALGDFNSDGRIDLAVVDTGVGKLSILSQTPLFVSPSLISFPKQLGGFPTAASTVTLRNTSTAPIAIGTPSLQGPNAADFSETDTCTGISLGAGQTCTFSIVFNPQDLGNRTAQIIIPEGVGNNSVGIALYGVGQLLVAIERNPHAFPTTLLGTSSAPYVANFKNYTNLPITVNVMELIGLDPQDYSFNFNVANPCPGASGFVAPPLSICYVNVVFTPTVKGSRTAGLTVYGHFSPGNGQQTILLSGLATGVSVKPAALTFPATTVGTSSTAKTVTVKNAYTTPLNVSVVFQAGNSKDFSETDNCKPTIAAGATCFVNVTFTPLATGTRTSALYIGDNDPTGPQIVTVTGTGQ